MADAKILATWINQAAESFSAAAALVRAGAADVRACEQAAIHVQRGLYALRFLTGHHVAEAQAALQTVDAVMETFPSSPDDAVPMVEVGPRIQRQADRIG